MNKFCIPLVLALLAMVFVSGCANTVETADESVFRMKQGWKVESLQLVDDLNDIFRINKNCMLSIYHQRVGYGF